MTQMFDPLYIRIGDFLYSHAFPTYNILYRLFKLHRDKHEVELIRQTVKPGDIVLDIGANIGFYTSLLAECVGSGGKVYAFEPDELNFIHLKKNVPIPQVICIQKAASDRTGTTVLFRSSLLNVDHKVYPTRGYTETVPVESIRVDDSIPDVRVDFIKIDIQGYEYKAFLGMSSILSSNPQIKILSEFCAYDLRQAGIDPGDFFRLFSPREFIISKCTRGHWGMLTENDIRQYALSQDPSLFINLFIEKRT